MASSSGCGSGSKLTAEERLQALQRDINELRILLSQQGGKIKAIQKVGTNRWELLNQELREIREELTEDLSIHMKDSTILTGGIGKRLFKLEKKVEDFIAEQGKPPNPEM